MGRMSAAVKWWSRVTAALTGAALALVVPVHAWAASNGVADVAIEAAKYRRRRSGFGFLPIFGGLCCLLVVAAIVLAIVLISRNRKRR
jgi:ABC-type multidrug transport system permease subunit